MPSLIDGLILQSYNLSDEGAGVWMLDAEYAANDEPQGESPTEEGQPDNGNGGNQQPDDTQQLGPGLSMDISAENVHITQALETTSYFRAPLLAAPNVKNIIGLSKSGIEGCDVVAPKTDMTITRTYQNLTLADVRVWEELVGHTNAAKFYGREIGEALYLGASINPTNEQGGGFTVQHKFGIAKNLVWNANDPEMVKRLKVGDIEITGGKKGWEYIWVMYEEQPNAVDGLTIEVPRYAFVARVYPSGNFNLLRL